MRGKHGHPRASSPRIFILAPSLRILDSSNRTDGTSLILGYHETINAQSSFLRSSQPKPRKMTPHSQHTALQHSLQDPESFWTTHANRLHWHRRPSRALAHQTKTLPSGVQHAHWSWFPDGEISTSYNCVDRHVADGRGDDVAIIWESPVTHTTQKYTYSQLLDEVEVLAGVLREEGVRKGDVVIIYSKSSICSSVPHPYPHHRRMQSKWLICPI